MANPIHSVGMEPESWLLEVIEAMPDGVVIVNLDGEMILVNRELERMHGYTRAELLGQPVEMLLPEAIRDLHISHRDSFARHPHRRAMGQGLDLAARRKDGQVFPVEISLAPAHIAGEEVVIASVRDVTAARLAEEVLESANRMAERELAAARERVLLAEDHERIARDLHDTVIQRMFAAGLSLQSVIPTVPEAARVKIERIIDDQDDAIRELRTAIFGLASKRNAGRTVRSVVNDLVDESARVLGYRPSLHFSGVLDTVDETVTSEVSAVVREALSNVARHARAHKVDVSLAHQGSELILTVTDDGAGIPTTHRLGSGILNMHDRAQRLGGSCAVNSGEQGGTTVRWLVPLDD